MDWLLETKNPSIRYWTLQWLAGLKADRSQVKNCSRSDNAISYGSDNTKKTGASRLLGVKGR
jgi:hypothetical protein